MTQEGWLAVIVIWKRTDVDLKAVEMWKCARIDYNIFSYFTVGCEWHTQYQDEPGFLLEGWDTYINAIHELYMYYYIYNIH